ncbi:hypothetical protein FGG08_003948 [Glutinoglossum americanum]|uniref:Protein kinase domain-containing protein n=1 Tax=Glutinoglossum americanum TaxID=1670608 RepID=A0A9P8HXB8_9PEZI|nr:hypothetical protein FGG08_003948 [Glutinoglossum americanum]
MAANHPKMDIGELKCDHTWVRAGIHGVIKKTIDDKLVVKYAATYQDEKHRSLQQYSAVSYAKEKEIYEHLGDHPFILKYYGETKVVLDNGEKMALVFQYHPAESLMRAIYENLMDNYAEKKMEWFIQIAEAVRYIHSKDVLHGLIEIDNFLIQSDGALVLADFGESIIHGKRERMGWSFKFGMNYTKECEIYSIGTLMYQISTNQQLYPTESQEEIAELYRAGVIPDLTAVTIPGIADIIEKCMTKKYNNVEELLQDLRPVVAANKSIPTSALTTS